MKKYTKLISAVLAAGLLAGILVFPGAAWEDKVSPWAVEELREAVALGLKNENFCDRINSRDDIDRFHFACEAGEFISCQLRLSLSSTPLYEYTQRKQDENGEYIPYFKDIDHVSVDFAYAYGIVQGRGDGIFDPDAPITREEAAVMLYNTYLAYANHPEEDIPELNLEQFADQDEISPWARQAVSTMAAWNVMAGMSETEFGPKSHYTYEQCWVTFLRLYKNAPEGRLKGSVKMPDGWDQATALAELRGRYRHVEEYYAETENYIVLFGGQCIDIRSDFRTIWVIYQNGGRETVYVPELIYYATPERFLLDEEHDTLYCTNKNSVVYKVDLMAATAEVVESVGEREWETEEYTVRYTGQSDEHYNFKCIWLEYKTGSRIKTVVPGLKYDIASEELSFDAEHKILYCTTDSCAYKVDLDAGTVEMIEAE